METEEMIKLFTTPEAAAFAAAVLIILLGLTIFAVSAVAVVLIAHVHEKLKDGGSK